MAVDILQDDLRNAIRLSLRPTSDIIHSLQDFNDPINPRDPRIRKLIEAILFSRRFILTYYVVLLIVVITWAGASWMRKVKSKSKTVQLQEEHDTHPFPVSSSSSSTLVESESSTPKGKIVDETLPLLQNTTRNVGVATSNYERLRRHARAAVVAQPAPIPAVTARQNTLPTNGTTSLVVTFLVLNLFYLFFRTPFSWSMVFAFGDRAGLVFSVNLPILYILGAKNNQPLRWLTGWSYEGLNLFHRRLGEWMTVVALIHGISMVIVWYTLLRPAGFSLGWYLTRKVILLGVFALFVYSLIYTTSIGYVRQASYEIFLFLHVTLQVMALVLLFFHHPNACPYVGIALAIWVVDRVIFRNFAKSNMYVADLEIAQDGETVLLYAKIPIGTSKFGISAGWRSGQHVFLTVPDLGWKHRLQTHPFTIASPAPPEGVNCEAWALLLVIRAQTGFSKDLLEFARYHQHSGVILDGPYGSTDVLEATHSSDRVCFVAGGSGIAVTYPIAWNYCFSSTPNMQKPVDLRTRYLNGKKHVPIIGLSQLPIDSQRYSHFWIRQTAIHENWIRLLPHAKASKYHTSNAPAPDSTISSTWDLITARFATRVTSEVISQRPDIGLELREWVESSGTVSMKRDQKICIVVSGPDTLVRTVRNSAASLIREGWRIEIYVEKFGW